MAKSKKDDETTDRIMWIVGGAALSAFCMYYVNKSLNEREDLKRLKYAEEQRQLKDGEG